MSYNASIHFYGKLFDPTRSRISTDVVQEALQKTREYGLALVKASTPVRSGAARQGWDAQVVKGGIIWKNPVPYSGFLEVGTRKMQGRHMLGNNLPAITKYFGNQVGRQLGKRIAANAVKQTPITYNTIRAFNR